MKKNIFLILAISCLIIGFVLCIHMIYEWTVSSAYVEAIKFLKSHIVEYITFIVFLFLSVYFTKKL